MFRRRPSMPDASTTDPQLIFRKFVEFLETDMWLLPINNFMEQNSIAFEREQGDPDTFVKIYKKFTELIDTLMDSYCQDTGINGQHLVEALKSTDKASKLSYKEKMMRKNIELQLQALKLLEHLSGLLPSSLKLDEDDAEMWKVLFDEDESERLILISVLKQSREEFEHDQRLREEWQKQIDAATQNSLKEKQLLESMRKIEQSRLDEAMKKTEDKFKNMCIGGDQARTFSNLVFENGQNTAEGSTVLPVASTSKHAIVENKTSNTISFKPNPNTSSDSKKIEKVSHDKSTQKTGISTSTKTVKSGKIEENKATHVNSTKNNNSQEKSIKEKSGRHNQEPMATFEQTNSAGRRPSLGRVKHHVNQLPDESESNHEYGYRALLKNKQQIPEEMLKQRAEYLKEQRDKLMVMKKKQREKQLIESSKATARPRTAQVARGALAMSNNAEDQAMESLNTRREIAAKIKSGVMNLPT